MLQLTLHIIWKKMHYEPITRQLHCEFSSSTNLFIILWPEQCTDKSNVKSQKIISEIFLNVDLSVRKAFKANVSNEHSNLDHLLFMDAFLSFERMDSFISQSILSKRQFK